MINLPSPDYEAPDVLVVQEPEQLRALGDDLRTRIVVLLRENAHSITELAESLDLPKGTVGHHVKVLEKAGLVRVVRTRQVRALTERYYGRTARLFLFKSTDDAGGEDVRNVAAASLRTAAEEMLPPDDDDRTTFAVLRMRRATPTRDASRAGSTSSSATSWTRTRTGNRSGSSRRSSGGRPMRRLRRPTGGLWANADFLSSGPGNRSASSGHKSRNSRFRSWRRSRSTRARLSSRHRCLRLPPLHLLRAAGAWVDRMRRKRILIVGDAARAVLLRRS